MKTRNTLRNLQQQFSSAVLGQELSILEQGICAKGLTARQRLNIYSYNVSISLRNALKAVYPVIHKLVGDEFFNAMANDFLVKYPSRSGNLHDFGNQLSSFISGFAPAGDLVYLSDVAQLEWAYHSVFHSADNPAFSIEKLQSVAPEKYGHLNFKLSSACRLLRSPFPVLRIWETNQDDGGQTDPEETQPRTISLDEGESLILVLRKGLDIEFQTLRPVEYCFLKSLEQHENFFAACDAATQTDIECNVGQLLQKYIMNQAIIDFDIAN